MTTRSGHNTTLLKQYQPGHPTTMILAHGDNQQYFKFNQISWLQFRGLRDLWHHQAPVSGTQMVHPLAQSITAVGGRDVHYRDIMSWILVTSIILTTISAKAEIKRVCRRELKWEFPFLGL